LEPFLRHPAAGLFGNGMESSPNFGSFCLEFPGFFEPEVVRRNNSRVRSCDAAIYNPVGRSALVERTVVRNKTADDETRDGRANREFAQEDLGGS